MSRALVFFLLLHKSKMRIIIAISVALMATTTLTTAAPVNNPDIYSVDCHRPINQGTPQNGIERTQPYDPSVSSKKKREEPGLAEHTLSSALTTIHGMVMPTETNLMKEGKQLDGATSFITSGLGMSKADEPKQQQPAAPPVTSSNDNKKEPPMTQNTPANDSPPQAPVKRGDEENLDSQDQKDAQALKEVQDRKAAQARRAVQEVTTSSDKGKMIASLI